MSKPSIPIPDTVRRLQAVLTDNVPFCSGTLALKPRDFLLYYGKDQLGRIDLSNTTPQELAELERACHPATFGVNQEDVLDESYRKAGKMDVDSFVLAFGAHETGLLDAVKDGLFRGTEESRGIHAELYKLNVYGKGSFFKPHKDTPRAANMFGSLVIVFPTPHEGGALFLRHDKHEWVFGSGKLLSQPSSPSRIAFVAFFSDVDHEVTPVVAGHRVTATYNLYFHSSKRALPGSRHDPLPNALHVLQPSSTNLSEVANAVRQLLADSSFLPNGGTLGFGLRHQYPLPKTWLRDDPNPLVALAGSLKGGDAALWNACTSHGLRPVLRILHEDHNWVQILPSLLDHIPIIDWAADEGCDLIMLRDFGATRMYRVDLFEKAQQDPTSGPPTTYAWRTMPTQYVTEADESPTLPSDRYYPGAAPQPRTAATVHMLTDVTSVNRIKSAFLAYGNDASMSLIYMDVCLIVNVGPFGDRARVALDGPFRSTIDVQGSDVTGKPEGTAEA